MRFQSEQSIVFLGDLSDFDARTDRLMDALEGLGGVADPDLAVNLRTGEVDVTLIVEADDYPSAANKAMSDLRTAIHAIGDATPGWEESFREVRMSLTPIAIRAEVEGRLAGLGRR